MTIGGLCCGAYYKGDRDFCMNRPRAQGKTDSRPPSAHSRNSCCVAEQPVMMPASVVWMVKV
jgi:hypothetical protein